MARPEHVLSFPFVLKGKLSAPEAEQILFNQVKERRRIVCFITKENGRVSIVDRNPYQIIQNDDKVALGDLYKDMQEAKGIVIKETFRETVKKR